MHHLSVSYNGGGEKWLVNVANELSKRGHDVSVFALPLLLEGKRKVNPQDLFNGVSYREGKHFKLKADACYVTYNPLSFLMFQTSHPRIAGVHAQSYWAKANLRYGVYPLAAKIAYSFIGSLDLKGFDKVHIVSRCLEVKHPNITYIPNFVDSTVYKPYPKKEKFTVCYVSRNNWQKGYDIALAIQKHLGNKIDFRFSNGQISEVDMPKFIGECHVAIVPSRVDTFGLSIVEALMCQVPVVTSDLNTHRALSMPLLYGSSLMDYIWSIAWLKDKWVNHRDYYDTYCDFGRQAAIGYYDKVLIMDKLEEMFTECVS
jgi:glycosyltransferase involved in cell wall biosynthesis